MRLSYNWLQDFVDLSDTSPELVAEKLTMGAFEVEEVEKFGDKLEGEVVLGEIREIKKHPDADKLNVTQTCIGKNEDGSDNIQQIVCGASNIAEGQRIPVATIGSKVINRHDGTVFEIKKAKIRGVESHGMLCSPDELGYSEEDSEKIQDAQGSEGIYILKDPKSDRDLTQSKDIGSDIRQVLGMEADYVFHVGARSNRGDALSVVGQAREICALMNKKLDKHQELDSIDSLKSKTNNAFDCDTSMKPVKPAIDDANDCYVFHTVAIENLQVCESPQWLKSRLEAMGTRSINNLVDVSNYVLLELGQPMHFYDAEKLNGDTLTVRRAKAGEQIKTLDDNEYKLSEVNLVIADAKEPVSLAGAMGGFESQITDTTTKVIVECASFTPASVRKSARAAGVESESKRRFERGVDKVSSHKATLRAIELLAQIAQEKSLPKIKVGEIITAGSDKVESKTVSLRLSQVKRYFGIEISKEQIIDLLKHLEFKFTGDSTQDGEAAIDFEIPSFRQLDIDREADLLEEISRLYGFDQIPVQAPGTSTTNVSNGDKDSIIEAIQSTFVAYGFSQAMLSSLIGDSLLPLDPEAEANGNSTKIEMLNPLSREHRVLRQSLMPGLIQAASRNYAYDKSTNIKLFEQGKAYRLSLVNKKSEDNSATIENAIETNKISAIMISTDHSWKQVKHQHEDFYRLKAPIEELYPRAVFKPIDEASDKDKAQIGGLNLAHPGISAVIYQDNRPIGLIAKLHPNISQEWDLPDHTYIFEANLPKVKTIKFKPIPNTPIVERDITADAPVDLNSQSIIDLVKKNASKNLTDVKLISLYIPDNSNQKSISYRLKWQSPTETLSGDAIDAEIVEIKKSLEAKLEVKFRE